ncbi:FkbM family methyltransferase [Porcipelethomonas sp.]|uniref:FkbM family methyltransferase n=1 Tax=Porcipelethomonas sp. TaxID=2981675 RepID=UPI003EF1B906
MENKNILLLGCSGLISTILADKLVNAGAFIDAAGRKTTENPKVNYIEWDIFEDNPVFFSSLKTEYDAVIVSAWAGNRPDERNNSDINMACARALKNQVLEILKCCRVKQIILTGSQSEYGKAYGRIDENFIIDKSTISPYGKGKLYLYYSLKESAGDTVVTELRFHSVYGFFPKKKQMLENVMNSMFKGNDVMFYSDGKHHYDFLNADDGAEAIISAVRYPENGIFNVSSNSGERFCDYIERLKCITGSQSRVIYGSEKSPDFIFCSDKFRKLTGWKSRISFEKGALKMFSAIAFETLRNKDVIIYGAGYCGLVFSDMLATKNILPKAFFDADPKKHGQCFNGIKISPAYECKNTDSIVIVCMLTDKYYPEIKENLIKLGYKNIKYIYELSYMEELFENQPLIFHMPENWQNENCEKIQLVNNLLADDISRETYKGIIEFAAGNHSAVINELPMNQQYFAYDVYRKNDSEVFVDCGAFRGDILKFFCENNSCKFNEYYAVEPDPANFCRIEQLPMAKDKRIHIIGCALSDKPETLKMKNYLNENSIVCSSGFDVTADTLDNICDKYNIVPTFIKIDVEGFEEKLLEGAAKTIEKYKPLIAMAIYHKCDDLWKLPIKIHDMLPDHRLFLRSYMNINETILYAVPEERVADEIY